jgi:hypothetical protein
MARTPKTTEAAPVTFSPEALAALLNEVTEGRKLMAAQMAELAALKAKVDKPASKMSIAGKSERSIKNEIAVIRAFKAKGFGSVVPHQDVKTFNKWMLDGLRPTEGTKSLRVGNLRLFHRSQVRPQTMEEKAAAKTQSEAAIARHTASVTELHPANPQ